MEVVSERTDTTSRAALDALLNRWADVFVEATEQISIDSAELTEALSETTDTTSSW
jgi:hypothetical protein